MAVKSEDAEVVRAVRETVDLWNIRVLKVLFLHVAKTNAF